MYKKVRGYRDIQQDEKKFPSVKVGRNLTVSSPENIVPLRDSVSRRPKLSIHRRCQVFGLTKSSHEPWQRCNRGAEGAIVVPVRWGYSSYRKCHLDVSQPTNPP